MNKETKDLMHQVARKLAGKDVEIRIQAPQTDRRAHGAVTKSADGRAVMDLNPELFDFPRYYGLDKILHVFLHEVAHVKLHHSAMIRTPAGGIKGVYIVPAKSDRSYQQHENEADTLAAKWQAVANKHWYDYSWSGVSLFEAHLRALLKHA